VHIRTAARCYTEHTAAWSELHAAVYGRVYTRRVYMGGVVYGCVYGLHAAPDTCIPKETGKSGKRGIKSGKRCKRCKSGENGVRAVSVVSVR